MKRERTPEERKAWGEKMKLARQAAKLNRKPAPQTPPPPHTTPIGPDIVSVAPSPRQVRPSPAPAPAPRPDSGQVDLVELLRNYRWLDLSYEHCCATLSVLRDSFEACADARGKLMEQDQALTHKAPCATCNKTIDISRSGGYQVRTVRDKFQRPINEFYCSPECVVLRNAREESRRAKEAANKQSSQRVTMAR